MKNLISDRFKFSKSCPTLILSNKQLEVKNVVENKLASKSYKLIHEDCPCGGKGFSVISEIDRYALPLQSVICSNCNTIRFDPYLDDKSVADFYTNYYQVMYGRSSNEYEYFEKQKLYGLKMLSLVTNVLPPNSTIIEIGCGAGGALSVFAENGYNVIGCDYDRRLLEYGKSRGLEKLIYGSIDQVSALLGNAKSELIYSHHVFEHVTNPLENLGSATSLLSEAGIIIHVVPDIYKIKLDDGYGGDILKMIHISHKYNYTLKGLQLMGLKVGLEISESNPDANLKTHASTIGELWFQCKKTSLLGNYQFATSEGLFDKLIQHEMDFILINAKPQKRKNFFKIIYKKVKNLV